MGELSAKCVKWLMFSFNFIFWICGITLIAAGAVAQSHYKEYVKFFANDAVHVTAPALLIVVGVFISIIAFLGCCGAARESYPMLMGFSVIVGIILVLQMSGGIAGYVQKGHITNASTALLRNVYIRNYFDTSTPEYKIAVDELQKELHCCGAVRYSDWFSVPADPSVSTTTVAPTTIPTTISTIISTSATSAPSTSAATTTTAATTSTISVPTKPAPKRKRRDIAMNELVVPSCCVPGKQCEDDKRKEVFLNNNCGSNPTSLCPIYPDGCEEPMIALVGAAITGVAGAAIGLAFFELIGVLFACYLARRIRSGYVYA